MADTLRAGLASGGSPHPPPERITAAIATLLASGAEAGSLRSDVEPEDVTVMLLGIFLAGTADDSEQTERLIDIVMAAPRPATTG